MRSGFVLFLLLLLLLLVAGVVAAESPGIGSVPGTLRVDYFHSGNAAQELFSIDEVVLESLPWPGNRAQLLDTVPRGKYFFEVSDLKTGQLSAILGLPAAR
jgi:hypothetical protein